MLYEVITRLELLLTTQELVLGLEEGRGEEGVGLHSITDGEFRRTFFHLDFLEQVGGVTVSGSIAANPDAKPAKEGFTPPRLAVTGKLRHKKNIQVDDFV